MQFSCLCYSSPWSLSLEVSICKHSTEESSRKQRHALVTGTNVLTWFCFNNSYKKIIYSGSFNNKRNPKYEIPASETEKIKSVPTIQHITEIPSVLPEAARRGCWRTCAGTWGQSCSSWKTQHSENMRSQEACLNQIDRRKLYKGHGLHTHRGCACWIIYHEQSSFTS